MSVYRPTYKDPKTGDTFTGRAAASPRLQMMPRSTARLKEFRQSSPELSMTFV